MPGREKRSPKGLGYSSSAEARIDRERALFRRIIISLQDLDDARSAVNRLLGLNAQVPVPPTDVTLRDALVASAVTSYGRIFVRSRGESRRVGQVPARFLKGLTPAERTLHTRLLRLRNQEFAHSDEDAADVKVRVAHGILHPVSRRLRRHSIADADLRGMDGIFSKLHIFLHDEMLRLYRALAPLGDF
jgi:hypothetical protein